MHELSIVMGIIKSTEKVMAERPGIKVTAIGLEIGTMAGIEKDALDFAWRRAIRGTILSEAERRIEWIKAQAKCLECNTIFDIEHQFDACPVCGSYFKDIFTGKQLRIKYLEVEKADEVKS